MVLLCTAKARFRNLPTPALLGRFKTNQRNYRFCLCDGKSEANANITLPTDEAQAMALIVGFKYENGVCQKTRICLTLKLAKQAHAIWVAFNQKIKED